ncbi:unnamed protein product [Miscanthus lutarioriparius]|uniref:Uncharacterized protein n=1 Tax=Miscanthus lutarioriparius TaxID=422564 RepID=A0A811N2V6_9POAL|nr:unnamed protein product [Miscanthus lutarioriparius]
MDEEAWMSARIAEFEREISESSSSLMRSKERISELEQRVSYMEKELRSVKDTAAANEHCLGAVVLLSLILIFFRASRMTAFV